MTARKQTMSLWSLIDTMQRCLEGQGLEPSAIDAEIARGLRSLLTRNMFASARHAARAHDAMALRPEFEPT